MSNNGDRYTRCKSPHCRNRCTEGETLCGEHGGTPYVRAANENDIERKSRFPLCFVWAVDDLTLHMQKCDHCRMVDTNPTPWLWDHVTRLYLAPQLCREGQHIMARVESAHYDHRIVLPLYMQRRSAELNRTIGMLMYHAKSCPTCRAARPLNRPIWEWTQLDLDDFASTCCTVALNLVKIWETYDRNHKAAA